MTEWSVPAVFPVMPLIAGWLWGVFGGVGAALFAAVTLRPGGTRRLLALLWRLLPGLAVWLGLVTLAVIWWSGVGAAWLGWRVTPSNREGTRTGAEGRDGESAGASGGGNPAAWHLGELRAPTVWPEFRGGGSRSGWVDNRPGPTRGGVVWARATDHRFDSSPAIVGDLVIAVGVRQGQSRLFGWRIETGDLVFSTAPAEFRAGFSSPVVDSQYLAVGEGLHTTTDARLLLFQHNSAGTPQVIDRFTTRGHVEGTPVMEGNTLWFTAGSDGVYCLDLDPRQQPPLRQRWHAGGERYPDAETALGYSQGHLYVGLGDPQPALVQLNAATGAEQSRLMLTQPCHCPPAVTEGRVYVGTGRAVYGEVAEGTSGELLCLDSETCECLWRVTTPGSLLTAIVATEGEVICTTVTGETLVYSRDGVLLNQLRGGQPSWSAPAVTAQRIYSLDATGRLTGWTRGKAERFWEVTLGPPGQYTSSPVVARGHLLVGTPESGFVCVGPGFEMEGETDLPLDWLATRKLTGEPTWQRRPTSEWPAEFQPVAPVQVAGTDWLVEAQGPAASDREPEAGPRRPAGAEVEPGAAVGGAADTTEPLFLICLDAGVAGQPTERWRFPLVGRVKGPLICETNRLAMYCEGETSLLVLLNRQSGEMLHITNSEPVADWPVFGDARGVLHQRMGALWHSSWEGESQWRRSDVQQVRAWRTAGGLLLGASSGTKGLWGLDLWSGETIWNTPVTGGNIVADRGAPLVVDGDQFWLRQDSGITGYSRLNGQPVWSAEWPPDLADATRGVTAWTGGRMLLQVAEGPIWELVPPDLSRRNSVGEPTGPQDAVPGGPPRWRVAGEFRQRTGARSLREVGPGGEPAGGVLWQEGEDWWVWRESRPGRDERTQGPGGERVRSDALRGDSLRGETPRGETRGSESQESLVSGDRPVRLGPVSGGLPPVLSRRGFVEWTGEGFAEWEPGEGRP